MVGHCHLRQEGSSWEAARLTKKGDSGFYESILWDLCRKYLVGYQQPRPWKKPYMEHVWQANWAQFPLENVFIYTYIYIYIDLDHIDLCISGWWCFGTWIDCFSIQLGMSSSQLTFIFFRGIETTNQIYRGAVCFSPWKQPPEWAVAAKSTPAGWWFKSSFNGILTMKMIEHVAIYVNYNWYMMMIGYPVVVRER